MKNLSHFSVPFKGLKNGIHEFQFIVDSSFFDHYENEIIKKGNLTINLTFDKNFGISTLHFEILGFYPTQCDRCMESIDLPIKGNFTLLLKFGEEADSTDEVMFIHPDTSILKLADLIYEYIILSIPMIKTYDCENDDPKPCNTKVLELLENEEYQNTGSSIWDNLKDLDFNNN